MTKTWVDKKNKEARIELKKLKKSISNYLEQCGLFDKEDIKFVFDELDETVKVGLHSFHFPRTILEKYIEFYKENCPDHKEAFYAFYLKADTVLKELPVEEYFKLAYINYDRYLDSEPMEFDGDILITDPCYVMKADHVDYLSSPRWWDYVTKTTTKEKDGETFYNLPRHEDYPDFDGDKSPTLQAEWDAYHKAEEKWKSENITDWERCCYGYNMEVLGINRYMTRDTIYGDWSCTVFDYSSGKERHPKIGEFCADAGLVSVFSLDEVLKYNPEYKVEEYDWSATVIKDFKGTCQFVVKKSRNRMYEDFYVEVVGKGINKKTGKLISFVGMQTGF